VVSPRPGPDVGDFRNFLEARRKFWGGVDRGVLAPAKRRFQNAKNFVDFKPPLSNVPLLVFYSCFCLQNTFLTLNF